MIKGRWEGWMSKDAGLIACIGCGAPVPDTDGPTYRYPEAASPGCWAEFGKVLVAEYELCGYSPIHRLIVDAYAVQHPGRPTPQTIQSVTMHLVGLGCMLARGQDASIATRTMGRLLARFKGQFTWLEPPAARGAMTVLDIVGATDCPELQARVVTWAESAWDAWSEHHATIGQWVSKAYE
jgi:hypothetical protein